MSNRFNGSYRTNPRHTGFKGLARIIRMLKQDEARARQANTLHSRTKAHRMGRCACALAEKLLSI